MRHLLLIILALSITGCYKPIWPEDLQPDAYLELDDPITVDIPALEGGTLTVAGVWAHPRTLVVDMVIEHPETDEAMPFVVLSATNSAHTGAPAELAWFLFERDGMRVDYAYPPPRVALRDHEVRPRLPEPQPLAAHEGRQRWGFSAWYPISTRVPEGEYVMRTRIYESYVDDTGQPPDWLGAVKHRRAVYALDQLDGTIVTVRDYRDRPDLPPVKSQFDLRGE